MFLLFWLFCLIQFSSGTSIPSLKLLDGNKIPLVGFGTSAIDKSEVESTIVAALDNGYRYIDTAFAYDNEKLIGRALKRWFGNGGKREELFISTKLPPSAMRPSDVEEVLNSSLNNLGIDYLDMYLIHLPFGFQKKPNFDFLRYENGTVVIDPSTDIIAIWKKLEEEVRAGKIKSIGISNFNESQILRVWEHAQIKPTNLQVETNVYIQQDELHNLCQKLGIVMTGYSPLGSGDRRQRRKREINLVTPIQHPIVMKIAQRHKKSPAQVLLRFNAQRNIVVISKSTNPARIKENIDIFDFELAAKEMDELKTLDQLGKYRKFDFITNFNGCQYHPEYPFSDRLRKS